MECRESLRAFAAVAFALLLPSLTVATCAQRAETTLVLEHANLIDGFSPEPIRDATVVIRGRDIEAVRSDSDSLPAGAKIIDLKGRWLLPGFVDAHVHLFSVPAAQRAVQLGSTTVRAMGTPSFLDVALREVHNAGATDIPNIVAAGYQVRPDLIQAFPTFLSDFPSLGGACYFESPRIG